MNREKEILLQLLLEKYGQPEIKPVVVKTQVVASYKKNKKRGKCVPTLYANERWTVEGIAMVHKMILNKMTNHEIAKAIGRSVHSIRTLRSQIVGKRAKTNPAVKQYLATLQSEPK